MGSRGLEKASTYNAFKSCATKQSEGIMWQLAEEQGKEKALPFSIFDERKDRQWSSGEQNSDNVEEKEQNFQSNVLE